jgi:hypothetical protein
MKSFIAAAALAAVAALPATAGALPPGDTSVPLGSTAACFVVATPAAPATCNFVGAGSSDVGYIGGGSGTYAITYKEKYAVCDPTTNTVSGYALRNATDDSGSLTPPNAASQTTWKKGVVYTITLNGEGWLAIGGQGTPGQDMASSPQVGPAPGYAGADDATGGKQVGAAC